jgi:zinc transporter ZupT
MEENRLSSLLLPLGFAIGCFNLPVITNHLDIAMAFF